MMRWLHRIVVGMVTLAVVGCASALSTPAAVPAIAADRGKTLEAQTFGQPRPGLTPEPFLPDILAEDSHDGLRLHSSVYVSPDGQELYFTYQSLASSQLTIWFIAQEDGAWSRPRVTPFSGAYDDNCAAFSVDGQRFYFTSNRPLSGAGEPEKASSIWFVERTGAHWSEPQHVGSPTDLDRDEGPLYFGAILEGGQGGYDVYRLRFEGGRYGAPENLGEPVNSALSEYAVLTAPDERFLVLYRFNQADKSTSGLYASFHLPDDTWTEPVCLDDSLGLELGFDTSLSPDGKILFLLDRGAGVYWVDVGVLELLRSE
jgi:hypothetical protein